MSGTSSGSSSGSPREGVIRVLVGALADESSDVREAAFVALQENARWNSRTVLDCCMASLRTVRRLGSHHARVFRIMASTIRAMDEQELDVGLMRKIAKLALLEMTSNKDINAVWQKAASELLVAIGSCFPDLMMDEVFLQLTGSVISVSAVVQTLAEFASLEASQFTPRVKGVLSRVLPLLGSVRDGQRTVFATAFKCWCWAISQYYEDLPLAPPLDGDTLSFLHSAFKLFLGTWVKSRDPKMRLVTVEALGEMVPLISEVQLKAALPELLPIILSMYKKEKDNPLAVTRSLRVLLDALLKSSSGAHLVDFQGLLVVLNSLLPMASTYAQSKTGCDSSQFLKNLNEVLQCFLTIGGAYGDALFTFLINRIVSKEDSARYGAITIFHHLLPRLHEAWSGRRSELVNAIRPVLDEQDLNLCKAAVELIGAMALTGWVEKDSGEVFVKFLARQCARNEEEVAKYRTEEAAIKTQRKQIFKTELKLGAVSSAELRTMCDKAMLLLAGTMPEMEHILWPYLLRLVMVTDYTNAVSTICKCISNIAKRRIASGASMEMHYISASDFPKPEDILARLLVLLRNPFGRNQLAFHILMVLYYLGDLFPKSAALFWEDEIPKLRAYIDDPEDLKTETWQQEAWDQMIVLFLAESLDAVQSTEWTMSLGNAFADQYQLYVADHVHSALLHRFLGILLQRVDNRYYVREKLEVMYRSAVISDISDRLGLAMGFGLVAAGHLDTVLEKLKRVLESESRSTFHRFLSIFLGKGSWAVDDVYAALALMYGYTAFYASSTMIESRIDALVGTNMLSGLLDVQTPTAKQAVITAIDLLGNSVLKAANLGAPFPLKKRDELLHYTLTLMSSPDSHSELDLLNTQVLALNACTTLLMVEPKPTVATTNMVLQATLEFFTLPVDPRQLIDSLMQKLTALLKAILITSGEDSTNRVNQLQHLLKSLDLHVSSSIECERSRACSVVLELLREFRALCAMGTCSLGCNEPCVHLRLHSNRFQRSSKDLELTAALQPSRESLNVGERLMTYLPRCADVNSSIRKCSVQILDLLFSLALILPNSLGSGMSKRRQAAYDALSALEELIAVTQWDSECERQDTLSHLVNCMSDLLTSEELAVALRSSATAICDKTRPSAIGAIKAISLLIQKRGQDLQGDVKRITQSLLAAAGMVGEKVVRPEVLSAVCCLAKHTEPKMVFDEILSAAERDMMTKDVNRLRGGWPIQDAFLMLAQHESLSVSFLEHIIAVLNQTPPDKGDGDKNDHIEHASQSVSFHQMPQAALIAIASFFRKGTVSRRAVEERYAGVFSALSLQFANYHGVSIDDVQPLRNVIKTFQDFCDCLGDREISKILAQGGEHVLASDQWTTMIGQIANCAAKTHPKEVTNICSLQWLVLKRTYAVHREVAAAILSQCVHHCSTENSTLLRRITGALSSQISDESWVVRQLCVKGLVEIPKEELPNYTSQVLSAILSQIEDVEEVAATAVQGLLVVLENATVEAVEPILLNLCSRLRSLLLQKNVTIRAAAFAALGLLPRFETVQNETFMDQMQATLPRVIFHLHDESTDVCVSCKTTLRSMLAFFDLEAAIPLTNSRSFNSDQRPDYEDFIKDFAKQLIDCCIDRMDNYISIAIQNFESPWPEIQANAAFFAGCLISQLTDHKVLALYLPQVVGSLVRMTANSPSPVVRSTCAKSLSILLNSIH